MTRGATLFPIVGTFFRLFFQTLELFAAGFLFCRDARADGDIASLETLAWYADNGQDEALVWGPELAWRPREALALRARWWQGSFNPGGDIEDVAEWRMTAGWQSPAWEAGAGYAGINHRTELQPNWAWSYPEEEAERNADIHGPLLYGRAHGRAGATPFGWRLGAAWLAYDFGDFDGLGHDGSFVEVEAALTFARDRWGASAGYLYRTFRDLPDRAVQDERLDRNTQDGLFAALTFLF